MPAEVGIYKESTRKKKIAAEYKRLRGIVEQRDNGLLDLVDQLLHDAAFMAITLDETRQIINRDGVIEEYQNGANQWGRKKSAATEVYDRMINTYTKVIKQICELVPGTGKQSEEVNLFMQHLQGQPK